MKYFTVLTPTYNRAKTLGRVYNSLCNQSYKEFNWLIIDDGSTDNTKELVEKWQNENKIEIDYWYKENGGKHTAMCLAWHKIKTKYYIGIDSDDELKPDAVETFKNEWQNIIDEGKEDEFAEVRALTFYSNGKLVGNYEFPPGVYKIDSNWHEMVLKLHNNNENNSCRELNKIKSYLLVPENFWLSDKINFFSEFILWARISRKYKTRYINKCTRIYHIDGGDSLQRSKNDELLHYNNIVACKYFLDENIDYFFWNPKYFLNLLLKLIISSVELKMSPTKILKELNSFYLKTAFLATYPLGLITWFYFKYIKKSFWL